MKSKKLLYDIILSNGEDYIKILELLPDMTVRKLNNIINSKEYQLFKENRLKSFAENADLHILNRLYKCDYFLNNTTNQVDDAKGYASILREYTNLIKITSPLLERMNKNKLEVELQNNINNLELRIDL